MPGDEYASVGGGGLRLKGVKGSKVEKHRKKKSKKPVEDDSSLTTVPKDRQEDEKKPARSSNDPEPVPRSEPKEDDGPSRTSSKTPAELRHEERRRKLLDERLKREGVKTHKERVEELNKYLSGLSEHHDMPKIGPG